MNKQRLIAIVIATFFSLLAVPMLRGMMLDTTQAAPTTNLETAKSADAFVDSMGVVTHWSYPDTPYGFKYEEVKQKLAELGLRHVRDMLTPRIQDLAAIGIKSQVGVQPNEGTPTEIKEAIKAANKPIAAIDSVEGPNEPDIFWERDKITYKNQGFPEGVKAFQQDLFNTFKNDPETQNLIVIGPAVGKSYDYNTGSPLGQNTLNNYVDWGAFHPYPGGGNPFSDPFRYNTIEKYFWHGNFPAVNIDEWPYAFDVLARPFGKKKMAATETGYNTSRTGISERMHGKYIPRLYLEYFRKGIVRTMNYELLDEWNDPDNPEANFGLLRNDLSPKPAYTAVKNLINLLKDPGANFTPDSLDYNISVNPPPEYDRTQYLHHLLLQKQNRTFYLALWHEISNGDITSRPAREITPPDIPVTITLKTPIKNAIAYSFDDNGNMSSQQLSSTSNINLNVQDKATILALEPQ
ncbi:hypothetical protein NIES2119_24970 [[Phormidium ambiguum] IAM M-71]|uniref:Uncharacterized protein n=1 Tax=[Phormidium ambiguum] IAM M-71 TaxID=454136 RepID=A0A1U7I8M5_9CYAN|nr:hypothetical protein [Phormidium ambiguum]OKH32832.1 hypothetical protein NIES2119_24970 [Phormidium ambiguum IAM M-71]